MKLVFIHGRAQEGKDQAALRATWETAFERGLSNAGLARPAGLEIAFPYYGDRLDELVNQLDTPLIADVTERGAQQDEDEAEFRGEFLEELAEHAKVTDDEIREFFGDDVRGRGVRNWGWVHATLKALDRSQKFGTLDLDTFTRDVYLYLTKRVVQRHIDSIVAPHITGDPCVVVAHSLGSVVGYNVLRDASHQVVRYVTVGSPLGVNAVKNRLKPPLGMPSRTASWFNAMDDGDVVALYPLDDDNFPTSPPIVNKTDVDNETDNQHGIVGYLPDPGVARAIHEALT